MPLAVISSVSRWITPGTSWEKPMPLRGPSKAAGDPAVSAPVYVAVTARASPLFPMTASTSPPG